LGKIVVVLVFCILGTSKDRQRSKYISGSICLLLVQSAATDPHVCHAGEVKELLSKQKRLLAEQQAGA